MVYQGIVSAGGTLGGGGTLGSVSGAVRRVKIFLSCWMAPNCLLPSAANGALVGRFWMKRERDMAEHVALLDREETGAM